jgi:hypothetical protein
MTALTDLTIRQMLDLLHRAYLTSVAENPIPSRYLSCK